MIMNTPQNPQNTESPQNNNDDPIAGLRPSNMASGSNRPDPVFDVSTEDFEDKVLKKSMEIPVIVDFWAPWCGPCKQLTPMLEEEVRKAGGKVLLAKVNMDENADLARALQIQSVPTIYAFYQGQPVTGFAGAKPQSEIRSLIQSLMQHAGGQQGESDIDIEAELSNAAAVLAQGDIQTAAQIYSLILQQDENNARAFSGLVRAYLRAGNTEAAKTLLDQAPDEIQKDPAFAEAQTAYDLAIETANEDPDRLARQLETSPQDLDTRYKLANVLFQTGQSEEAIDHLIEIIRQNREWEDNKAREKLLKFFEALGPQDPATIKGRRRLSSVLFS